MIIGTAGHIDHGKTSLVKAITGVDADRLREEKQRGITIDLGFAYWPQPDGSSIGFVDVPGHEGYIHNMLAGITGVSAMMLVIAVNDGIKPQTLEHLQIARFIGLENIVVALSKADLANDALLARRRQEIAVLLADHGFEQAVIIPVSSRTGLGVDALKAELLRIAMLQESKLEGSNLALPRQQVRIAVDRIFSLDGVGTVVTGSVQSGEISRDDRLLLSPEGREVRIRAIHAQNRPADFVGSGQRAALNLAGLRKDEASRGDMLVSSDLHYPTQRIDVHLTVATILPRPLPVWTPVHFHSGTGHWPARLVPLETDKLLQGSEQLVQIVFEKPMAIFCGERFVLRDASASSTIAGGIVLDRRAPERNRRKPERLAALKALAQHGVFEALPKMLLLPPYALDIHQVASDWALPSAAWIAVITRENLIQLSRGGTSFLLDPALLLQFSRQIREKLRAHHDAFPDQAGLTPEKLRLALRQRVAAPVFDAILDHLDARNEIAFAGVWVRLPDHVPKLSVEHEKLWAKLVPDFLGEHRFKAPRVTEMAERERSRPETIRGLMKRLARRGDIQEIVEDQFLTSQAIAELATLAQETGQASVEGWFNAASYRDRVGIGRKMAILILEFFDRQGLTIRKGDMRKLDQRKLEAFLKRR